MTQKQEQAFNSIPLFISRSTATTEANKTGSWRFARPVYMEKTAPCSAACPVGEDIARIEMLVNQGRYKEAWETILIENPFPAICGRVCFHPCEGVCNRTFLDQPIAIHNLERFIGDFGISQKFQVSKFNARLSKKIAIAGAGPAGLSAAYFLERLGYECDIFEADSEPGGLLRWGIPAYRLPADIVIQEISRITELGVNIHCRKPITRTFLDAKNRYDAVFIACGYGRSLQANIPGENMICDGLQFLRSIRNGKNDRIQGTAAIIGGGNTAIDVSRSLLRLGAEPILIYRRQRQDMPAFSHEIEMAIAEGVKLRELFAPVRIEKKGEFFVLTLQKMKPIDADTDGRSRVIPDEGKIESITVQHIFMAIGAEPQETWQIPAQTGSRILEFSHCSLIRDELPVIFGGDLTNPVKSVTDAIASGKQAAMVLDTLFQKGLNAIDETLAACRVGNTSSLSMEMYIGGKRKNRNPHTVLFEEINPDYFHAASRIVPQSLFPNKAIESFSEIEHTFSTNLSINEAKRCFNCGFCNDCDNCRLFCPEMAVFPENTRHINLDYCKGCGICVIECPRNAMILEEEKA